MATNIQNLFFAAAMLLYPVFAFPSASTKEEGPTGTTKSPDGRGIPFGSSTDGPFLTWLKPTDDSDYGYVQEKPVEIGGFLEGMGNEWPAQYFRSLLGPNGEATSFERVKSCCGFEVKNPKIIEAGIKVGFLDQFKVTVEGKTSIYIYVTLYTERKVSAPKGFTTRGSGT